MPSGYSGLGEGILSILLANQKSEQASQEAREMAMLPYIMQSREKALDRQAAMEREQLRYDSEFELQEISNQMKRNESMMDFIVRMYAADKTLEGAKYRTDNKEGTKPSNVTATEANRIIGDAISGLFPDFDKGLLDEYEGTLLTIRDFLNEEDKGEAIKEDKYSALKSAYEKRSEKFLWFGKDYEPTVLDYMESAGFIPKKYIELKEVPLIRQELSRYIPQMVGKTEEDVTERLYGGIGQIADSIETALQNQLGEFMGLPPPGQAPDSTGAPSGSAALQARRAAAAERYKR